MIFLLLSIILHHLHPTTSTSVSTPPTPLIISQSTIITISDHVRPWKLTDDASPPRWSDLSDDERKDFTRDHLIKVEESMFVDDSGTSTKGTHYAYDERYVNNLLRSAVDLASFVILHGAFRGARLHSRKHRLPPPKESEVWLLEGLAKFLPTRKNASVLVIGSMSPWHEVLCLAFGATQVHTLEYNELTYEHSQLETFTPKEFWSKEKIGNGDGGANDYDFILSISSFDHDGLGRYGDPISPDGDLLTMQRIHQSTFMTNTTKLFVTVPVGQDLLAWNLMRVYGRVRLPMFLQNFNVVEKYGYDDGRVNQEFGGNSNFRQTYEPVFVLEKKRKDEVEDEETMENVERKEMEL